MIKIFRHLNIVNLMGVCLPTEADTHPMLLLELCEVTIPRPVKNLNSSFSQFSGKPGEAASEEQGQLFAPRYKTFEGKVHSRGYNNRCQCRILSEVIVGINTQTVVSPDPVGVWAIEQQDSCEI